MTRDDIIRMAREAGFRAGHIELYNSDPMPFVAPCSATDCMPELVRFAARRRPCNSACRVRPHSGSRARECAGHHRSPILSGYLAARKPAWILERFGSIGQLTALPPTVRGGAAFTASVAALRSVFLTLVYLSIPFLDYTATLLTTARCRQRLSNEPPVGSTGAYIDGNISCSW